MTKRRVYIAGLERWVPLGAYVKAIRLAKARPEMMFKHGLGNWWPTTGRDILREFLASVHDRINAGIPYVERGTVL